jgi:hypothetical protein
VNFIKKEAKQELKEKVEKGFVIDLDGNEVRTLYQGDRILTQESQEYLDNTQEFKKKEPFLKLYLKTLFPLFKYLNGTEALFFLLLSQYINYTDGILKKSDGTVLTREDISEISGQTLRNVDRTLKGLLDKQVISRNRTGKIYHYLINPFIINKGLRLDNTFVGLFEKTAWSDIYKK